MKDTELYELCKEVWQKTKWGKTHQVILHFVTPGVKNSERIGEWHNNGDFEIDRDGAYPLYTSDYIMDKLPFGNAKSNIYCKLSVIRYLPDKYGAYWEPENDEEERLEISDTPVKALLKLTLALHKANELTPPQKDI